MESASPCGSAGPLLGVDRFDHEPLDVFQVAADFADLADRIVDEYECGRADLLDQLRGASSSTCLNIAEGSGEFRPKEKARLYRIARRSATESAAVIELLQRRSVRLGKPVEHLDTARALAARADAGPHDPGDREPARRTVTLLRMRMRMRPARS